MPRLRMTADSALTDTSGTISHPRPPRAIGTDCSFTPRLNKVFPGPVSRLLGRVKSRGINADGVFRRDTVGHYGSIVVIERFIRTFKDEGLRRILVPLNPRKMRAEANTILGWYNRSRTRLWEAGRPMKVTCVSQPPVGGHDSSRGHNGRSPRVAPRRRLPPAVGRPVQVLGALAGGCPVDSAGHGQGLAQLDFFSDLPKEEEQKLEAETAKDMW